MNFSELCHGDHWTAGLWSCLQGLCIHPFRSVGVCADLEVFIQLFSTDRAALDEKELNLSQEKRVPLDRGRVVRLLVPDVAPDRARLVRQGQAAYAVEFVNRPLQPLVDELPRRAWHILTRPERS